MLAGSMDPKTAIVAGLPIFAKLEPRSLEAVATLARVIVVPEGTVLLREGEPAESFFVIVSGTVRVERLGRFVRSMSDGGFLGEVALIEGRGRTATATCTTGCDLLEFGSFEFGRIMATFPDVRTRVEAALARRPHADGGEGER
jgi:CRP-like cAMP-binding protein